MGKHAPYPSEVRARAVELYLEHGAAEASRRLVAEGHPKVRANTIAAWAVRAGVTLTRSENVQASIERSHASIEERRVRLADQLMDLAKQSAEQASQAIADASLRDLVGAWDYAIKNAQLLTGAATARTETLGDPKAKAIEVLDELAERRKIA